MNQILIQYHTPIIIVIFIVIIFLLGLGLKEDYLIYNPKLSKKITTIKRKPIFNIDYQIKNNSKYLGWKTFWRKNYSKLDPNIDKIFVNKPFSTFKHTKFKYDGVLNSPPI